MRANRRWKTRTDVERRNRERSWLAKFWRATRRMPGVYYDGVDRARRQMAVDVRERHAAVGFEIGGVSQAAVDAMENLRTRYIDTQSQDTPPLDCGRR